jgi:hypothetical protein
MTGYIVIWVAIVLAFVLLTATLPSLLRLVLPSSFEHSDLGLISLAAGFIGLFIGLWPAFVGVEWLVKRNDRRAREKYLRSGASEA